MSINNYVIFLYNACCAIIKTEDLSRKSRKEIKFWSSIETSQNQRKCWIFYGQKLRIEWITELNWNKTNDWPNLKKDHGDAERWRGRKQNLRIYDILKIIQDKTKLKNHEFWKILKIKDFDPQTLHPLLNKNTINTVKIDPIPLDVSEVEFLRFPAHLPPTVQEHCKSIVDRTMQWIAAIRSTILQYLASTAASKRIMCLLCSNQLRQ